MHAAVYIALKTNIVLYAIVILRERISVSTHSQKEERKKTHWAQAHVFSHELNGPSAKRFRHWCKRAEGCTIDQMSIAVKVTSAPMFSEISDDFWQMTGNPIRQNTFQMIDSYLETISTQNVIQADAYLQTVGAKQWLMRVYQTKCSKKGRQFCFFSHCRTWRLKGCSIMLCFSFPHTKKNPILIFLSIFTGQSRNKKKLLSKWNALTSTRLKF